MSSKKKKLDDFTTADLEKFIAETVAQATKERIAPFDTLIKKLQDRIDKFEKRMDVAAETVMTLAQELGEAKEGANFNAVAQAIQRGFDGLIEYEKGAEARINQRYNGTPKVNIAEQLKAADIDIELLEIDGNTVKPKKFLGDLWGPINDAVRGLGGRWLRDGKNSRWEIGGTPAPQQPEQPRPRPQIKNPNAPASEAQKKLLDRLKVVYGPNLTKGDASKLIEHHKKW